MLPLWYAFTEKNAKLRTVQYQDILQVTILSLLVYIICLHDVNMRSINLDDLNPKNETEHTLSFIQVFVVGIFSFRCRKVFKIPN